MRTIDFGPDEVRAWRGRLMDALSGQGVAWCDERRVVV